jgi:hypothetical protein
MTPEPGHARLPDAAQVALAGSAAEFIARQLDERARLERSAVAGAPAAGAPAAGGHGSAEDRVPDAAPATAQVRWSWGPIAVMVVPLLILLALTLA